MAEAAAFALAAAVVVATVAEPDFAFAVACLGCAVASVIQYVIYRKCLVFNLQ